MRKRIHGEADHFRAGHYKRIVRLYRTKETVTPEEVEVELMYDDGFSAESWANGRKQVLITANIIEALRLWLDEHLNLDPFSSAIEPKLDEHEGIHRLYLLKKQLEAHAPQAVLFITRK